MKSVHGRLLVSYFFFFLPAGLLISALGPFMQQKGMTLGEIGAIVGCLFGVKLVVSPAVAYLADRHSAHAGLSVLLFGFSFLCCLGLQAGQGFEAELVSIVGLGGARNFMQAMLESRAAEARAKGSALGYSEIRVIGSVAVVLGVLLSAFFPHADVFGWDKLPFCLALSTAGLAASLSLPAAGGQPAPAPRGRRVLARDATARELLMVLLVAGLLVGANGTAYAVASVSLGSIGYSGSFVQWCWIVAFASEAVGFLLLGWMERSRPSRVVALILVAGVARWSSMCFALTPALVLMAAFALHGVTFSWVHARLVVRVRSLFSPGYGPTGQAVYFASAHGVGIAAVSAFSARLYSAVGFRVYAIPLAITVAGCALWAWIERRDVGMLGDA